MFCVKHRKKMTFNLGDHQAKMEALKLLYGNRTAGQDPLDAKENKDVTNGISKKGRSESTRDC